LEVFLFMLKNLPHGTKISISRSIALAFEKYMNKIGWDEGNFSPETFVQEWRDHVEKHSTWFHSLSETVKQDPSFHEELANKINELIEKVLSEKPTEEQTKKLEQLAKELNIEDIDYSCKAEANYHIERLERLKQERR
jgi:tRNA nucleotidyltransferase/poly(A) polymerase